MLFHFKTTSVNLSVLHNWNKFELINRIRTIRLYLGECAYTACAGTECTFSLGRTQRRGVIAMRGKVAAEQPAWQSLGEASPEPLFGRPALRPAHQPPRPRSPKEYTTASCVPSCTSTFWETWEWSLTVERFRGGAAASCSGERRTRRRRRRKTRSKKGGKRNKTKKKESLKENVFRKMENGGWSNPVEYIRDAWQWPREFTSSDKIITEAER